MSNVKTAKAYWKIAHLCKPITLQEQAGLVFGGWNAAMEEVEWIGDEEAWKKYDQILSEHEFQTV